MPQPFVGMPPGVQSVTAPLLFCSLGAAMCPLSGTRLCTARQRGCCSQLFVRPSALVLPPLAALPPPPRTLRCCMLPRTQTATTTGVCLLARTRCRSCPRGPLAGEKTRRCCLNPYGVAEVIVQGPLQGRGRHLWGLGFAHRGDGRCGRMQVLWLSCRSHVRAAPHGLSAAAVKTKA